MGLTKNELQIRKLTAEKKEVCEMLNAANANSRILQQHLKRTGNELSGFHRAADVKKSYCEHLVKLYGPDWAKTTTQENFTVGLGLFVAGVNYKDKTDKALVQGAGASKTYNQTAELKKNG